MAFELSNADGDRGEQTDPTTPHPDSTSGPAPGPLWWRSRLRIQHCHCCGTGSVSGPDTSTCGIHSLLWMWGGKKKKRPAPNIISSRQVQGRTAACFQNFRRAPKAPKDRSNCFTTAEDPAARFKTTLRTLQGAAPPNSPRWKQADAHLGIKGGTARQDAGTTTQPRKTTRDGPVAQPGEGQQTASVESRYQRRRAA